MKRQPVCKIETGAKELHFFRSPLGPPDRKQTVIWSPSEADSILKGGNDLLLKGVKQAMPPTFQCKITSKLRSGHREVNSILKGGNKLTFERGEGEPVPPTFQRQRTHRFASKLRFGHPARWENVKEEQAHQWASRNFTGPPIPKNLGFGLLVKWGVAETNHECGNSRYELRTFSCEESYGPGIGHDFMVTLTPQENSLHGTHWSSPVKTMA
ncbi:hypothetical protein BS47DRAFT_1363508 [Hydnum rufescens UP504]|uniref:Uncharacterized protein n=1 Tax=Hydnum rufescens UP504 TaxID=1448309 RepID=A0A9P6AUV6_9AGAM|nr:hypothetical protein BS47DRAFT_1363508 [Hydnum rufescens UP504]